MRLIRKIEKPVERPILRKTTTDLSQQIEPKTTTIENPKLAVQVKEKLEESNNKLEYVPNYYSCSVLDKDEVKSINHSGLQASDIWRELRVDSYCEDW
ncbi:hypothetical protein A6770_40435 [Nostoc minutum NIES-26]|uniref:Uncharacterized protein n=1 Tax=Nostoc minutum NIES-26 TaxID=1844469 RepID=A0A367RKF3_9NOSO|nr:hypothetical protein A6770_40435 [Nostoc minutum NIES-26]